MGDSGLNTDLDPILVRRVIGLSSNESLAEQLEGTAAYIRDSSARGRRHVLIVDLSKAERAPPVQRKMQSDWLEQHEALLKRSCVGAAYVAPNAAVRGAMTAIFWVKPPPHPHVFVSTLVEALDWAAEALKTAGIDLPKGFESARERARRRG